METKKETKVIYQIDDAPRKPNPTYSTDINFVAGFKRDENGELQFWEKEESTKDRIIIPISKIEKEENEGNKQE